MPVEILLDIAKSLFFFFVFLRQFTCKLLLFALSFSFSTACTCASLIPFVFASFQLWAFPAFSAHFLHNLHIIVAKHRGEGRWGEAKRRQNLQIVLCCVCCCCHKNICKNKLESCLGLQIPTTDRYQYLNIYQITFKIIIQSIANLQKSFLCY